MATSSHFFNVGNACLIMFIHKIFSLHLFIKSKQAFYTPNRNWTSYLYILSKKHTARLLNTLPAECLPLTHDLSGFMSRVSRHFLWAQSNSFPTYFSYLSCNVMPPSGCSTLHGVKPCIHILMNPEDQLC